MCPSIKELKDARMKELKQELMKVNGIEDIQSVIEFFMIDMKAYLENNKSHEWFTTQGQIGYSQIVRR